MMEPIAPMTSARWYPKDIFLLAGLCPSQIENIEIKKPDKSENICAASERMASDLAKIPPNTCKISYNLNTSAIKKIKQTTDTVNNLQRTDFETF